MAAIFLSYAKGNEVIVVDYRKLWQAHAGGPRYNSLGFRWVGTMPARPDLRRLTVATFAQMRSLPASPIILAGCVVTMNDSSEIHSKGCICVEGDRIAHVGKTPTDMPSPLRESSAN